MDAQNMKNPRSGVGLFVAGFRWSGSGAVSDWLAGHEDLCRVKGSEASFGEIRALNYGLRYLVQTAAGRIPYGERLGRWALCPDPKRWKELLGPPLSHTREGFSSFYVLLDILYTTAARFRVIPPVTRYKDLLENQLGGHFWEDSEYIECVTNLVGALRRFQDKKNGKSPGLTPENDESVRLAASEFLSLFVRRLGSDGRVPILDNAISGMNPELFDLIHPSIFPAKIILFVKRDPRDQYVDLVKYSGSTFSWNAGSFVRQYRKAQERLNLFLENLSAKDETDVNGYKGRFIRTISFEDFVTDKNGARTILKRDLQRFWKSFGIKELEHWKTGKREEELVDGANMLFNPESSRRNIGIWRNSGMKLQIKFIEKELPEFLEDTYPFQ